MRNSSKRLVRWFHEFGEHDLDIRYRKGSKVVVFNAISRRSDFLGKGSRNRAFLAMIKEMDEDEWVEMMIIYLRNGL